MNLYTLVYTHEKLMKVKFAEIFLKYVQNLSLHNNTKCVANLVPQIIKESYMLY